MNFFLDFQISVSRLNLYFLFKKLFRWLLNFKKTRAWCFARGEREIAIEFQTCRFLVLCGSRCAPVCVCWSVVALAPGLFKPHEVVKATRSPEPAKLRKKKRAKHDN